MDPEKKASGQVLSELRCPECNTTKPFTEDFWRRVGNQLAKKRCLSCQNALRTEKAVSKLPPAEREAVRLAEVADRGLPPKDLLAIVQQPSHTVAAARKKADLLRRKVKGLGDVGRLSRHLSTLVSMQSAAEVMNREAATIMELLASYATDPSSSYHEFALREFLERLVPKKAFTALAIKEAGLEEAAGKMQPQITINVVAASPAPPPGRVIEPLPAEDEECPSLPAPEPSSAAAADFM